MAVCTGCSLLCEDIEVDFQGGKILKTKNLCRKGLGRFKSMYLDRAEPSIDGSKVAPKEAVAKAGEILSNAKSPLVLGLCNCTNEAQKAGLDLARSIGGMVDDSATYCDGLLMEAVLKGTVPTCTLDDVRNFADMAIFWGTDPSCTHPRHMSRFSYFPRGEKRQRGYEEDRTAITIDVKKSPTATISGDDYYNVPPGGDEAFIDALMAVLNGKIPKVGDKKRMISLATTLKKAEFGAVFPGGGLVHSLKDKMGKLFEFALKLNSSSSSKYHIIPTVPYFNSRGFNQTLLETAGQINRASFVDGFSYEPGMGLEDSLSRADAVLVLGMDPISSLPINLAKMVAGLPVVVIDPHRSLTTDLSSVTIPSALSGLEVGGSAIRTDGVKIEYDPLVQADSAKFSPDEKVLAELLEVV